MIAFLHNKWAVRTMCSVVAGLFLLAAAKFGERLWIRHAGESELAKAIASTDASDLDWRWDDLNAKRPRPPAGRNGADLVPIIKSQMPKDWGKKLFDASWEPIRGLPTNARYPDEVIAEAHRECAAAKDAIATARKFRDCPFGFHSVQLAANPIGTWLPYLQDSRPIPILLRWDVAVAAEDGNGAQAADSLLSALNASRSIGSDPFAASQLVRIVMREISTRSLERAMAQGELPADRLAILQSVWASDAEEPLLLYAALGERTASDVLIYNLQTGAVDYHAVVGKEDDEDALGQFGWWNYRNGLSADRARFFYSPTSTWSLPASPSTTNPVPASRFDFAN